MRLNSIKESILYAFLLLIIFTMSLFARDYEKDYQKIFCNKFNGQIEVPIKENHNKPSRIDCVFKLDNKTYAMEVDWGHKAYESIGQTEYYSWKTGYSKAILLIQKTKSDNRYIGKIKPFCKAKNIRMFVINKKKEIGEIK